MSVNETTTQNVQQHHFLQPWEGGGRCGRNSITEVVGIATLLELDKNDQFLTASCGPYVTPADFFLHILPIKNIFLTPVPSMGSRGGGNCW